MRILSLSLKNIQKLLHEQKGLICILIIVEMLCLISILFAYGVYCNYQTVKSDDIFNSRRVNITFGVNQDGEPVEEVLIENIQDAWEEVEQLLQEELCSALICSTDEDENLRFYGVKNYSEPEYDYLDLSGQELIVSGRFFTSEEQDTGTPVAMSFWENRQSVRLHNMDFTIVGTLSSYFGEYSKYIESGNEDIYYVPLKSIPKDSTAQYIEFCTSRMLSVQTEDQIKNIFSRTVGTFKYDGCDMINMADMESQNGILYLAVFMAVLAAVNLLAIYGYLCDKRNNAFAVYRVCGSKRRQLCEMMLAEIFIMTGVSVVGADFIYAGVLKQMLKRYFIYLDEFYSAAVYLRLSLLFIVILMIFGTVMVLIRAFSAPMKVLKNI